MTTKATPADADDLIRAYLTGISVKDAASQCGIGYSRAFDILKQAGFSTKRRLVDVDKAAVIAMFQSGIGAKGVAEAFGVSRCVINRVLKEFGIPLRDRSQQQFARMARSTPEEIKALVAKANEAARGRTVSRQTLEQAAQTREATKHIATSDYEFQMQEMLQARGIETVHQKAIGMYNCDLAAFPVAVEIAGGQWHWHGSHLARTDKRFRELMNSGWHVLMVAVTQSFPLTDAVADYVAAYIQKARSNPSAAREYRVIWGAGEFSVSGGLDDDHISIKPPFTNARDITNGRYKRVAC